MFGVSGFTVFSGGALPNNSRLGTTLTAICFLPEILCFVPLFVYFADFLSDFQADLVTIFTSVHVVRSFLPSSRVQFRPRYLHGELSTLLLYLYVLFPSNFSNLPRLEDVVTLFAARQEERPAKGLWCGGSGGRYLKVLKPLKM